jgi:hypothetical protein
MSPWHMRLLGASGTQTDPLSCHSARPHLDTRQGLSDESDMPRISLEACIPLPFSSLDEPDRERGIDRAVVSSTTNLRPAPAGR